MTKVQCMECDWVGDDTDALSIPHPFLPDRILEGCPKCREANVFFPWEEPEPPLTHAENVDLLIAEIGQMVAALEILTQKDHETSH